MFEMACGFELSTVVPSPDDLSRAKHPDVCKVTLSSVTVRCAKLNVSMAGPGVHF